MPTLDDKAPRTSVQLTYRAMERWSLAAKRTGMNRTTFLEALLRRLDIPLEEEAGEHHAKVRPSNSSSNDYL